MEKNNKQLLIRDICARLPYGVYIKFKQYNEPLYLSVKDRLSIYNGGELINNLQYLYLRPMASMTEEEIKKYRTLQDTACSYHYEFGDIVDDFLYFDNEASLSYLNSIHIDYRGLIPMGLALEAPENMYN